MEARAGSGYRARLGSSIVTPHASPMNNTRQAGIDPVLSTLEPAAVWAHFATLCRIPRQSKAEGRLRGEIRRWALARGLSATVDAAGNLLLCKVASSGMDDAPGVILQAHLDMVCEKNAGTAHDLSLIHI